MCIRDSRRDFIFLKTYTFSYFLTWQFPQKCVFSQTLDLWDHTFSKNRCFCAYIWTLDPWPFHKKIKFLRKHSQVQHNACLQDWGCSLCLRCSVSGGCVWLPFGFAYGSRFRSGAAAEGLQASALQSEACIAQLKDDETQHPEITLLLKFYFGINILRYN